jgi:hypothetical protein
VLAGGCGAPVGQTAPLDRQSVVLAPVEGNPGEAMTTASAGVREP